ncbi:hypothetical protein KM043_004781 [Ampulex compressa]|nr:hypothetical protein KM043_004781 [Ampulex compressa]
MALRRNTDYNIVKITIFVIALVIFLAVIVAICVLYANWNYEKIENELIPPDPVLAQPPSWSKLRIFQKGAVCVDGAPCALIGKSILEKNGSAVDATIAALICNGLVTMQSMGLGGGFIMMIYERSKKRAYVLNARDRAPLAANSTMYDKKSDKTSFTGGLSIAVPGELAGYWEAHKRFGKLSWLEIFSPNIELCKNGYMLAKSQYDDFQYNKRHIYEDATLRDWKFRETGIFDKTKSSL